MTIKIEMTMTLTEGMDLVRQIQRNAHDLGVETSSHIRLQNKVEELEKSLREATDSMSPALRDAKDSTLPSSFPGRAMTDLRQWSAIFSYMNAGDKISAIKLLRSMAGCGLKEAKDVIEGKL